MMLRNNQTEDVPDAVFRIWHFREKIEIEAAYVFGTLAEQLSLLWGAEDPVATLARAAQEDERRHQKMCRAILNLSLTPFASAPADVEIELGPKGLSLHQKTLFAAVAMGCVTESLSTALLVQMHKRAREGIFKDTVRAILKDEVKHARIGWAELARAQAMGRVDWLSDYIGGMIKVAIAGDIAPMLNGEDREIDLSRYGILTRRDAKEIMAEVVKEVIVPGLRSYGIHTAIPILTSE